MSIQDQDNDILSSKLLLVEDVRVNLLVLEKILRQYGYCNIETATNGLEAIEKIENFQPDLVLLDILMPELDGFGVCQKVRSDTRFQDLPIVVQTSLTESEEKSKIFDVGATDYVTKPIDEVELIARVRLHLERMVLFKDLQSSRQRMADELEQARQMQTFLMPTQTTIHEIEKNYDVNITSCCVASSEMGGDFWGVKGLDSERFAIFSVDFSGHGVSAALNTFRLHTLMQHDSDVWLYPGEYLSHLNDQLVQLLAVEQFATMFYGVVDTTQATMKYATAAAPNPFMLRPAQDVQSIMLSGSGLPLGIRSNTEYVEREVPMCHDDMIVLYSDALVETKNPEGEFLSDNTILDLLNNTLDQKSRHSQLIFDVLMSTFKKEYYDNIRDDLTLVVLGRNNASQED